MHCSEFEEELNDLIDRRLPLHLSATAVEHWVGCRECQILFTGYQTLDEAVVLVRSHKETPEWETPSSFNEAIPVAAPATKTDVRQPDRSWTLVSIVGACIPVVAATVLLGIGLSHQLPQPETHESGGPAPGPGPVAMAPITGDQIAQATPRPNPTAITSDNETELREFLAAAGRVDLGWSRRAPMFQLPGLQPLVYPVGGAVEALRDTLESKTGAEGQ